MAALLLAAAICLALVAGRILVTRDIHYGFLIWNLFLAWVPLMFASVLYDRHRSGQVKGWRPAALFVLWLLFFPNAPYIFTDVIHLAERLRASFWIDLSLVLSCAFTGLLFGFLSLYLLQGIITHKYSAAAGWLFSAGMLCLSGFGIYMGRFLRFNSWDVFLDPLLVYHRMNNWVFNPRNEPQAPFMFAVLFSLFLLISYVILYSLTHLGRPQPQGQPVD
jgi:uncharacterized membrane protein